MTRAGATTTTTLVVALLAGGVAPARAQAGPQAGRIEIDAGPIWMGRSPLTSGDAQETTSTAGAFRLFTTSTTLTEMIGAEVRIGVPLGRSLEVFGAGSFGTRQLRIAATDDVENAVAVTAAERVEQVTVTGGVLWFVSRSRVAPFVSAEAGMLRELHEERTLVEGGRVYLVGGGVEFLLSTRNGGVKALGARVDARAVLRSKGFLLDGSRLSPAIGVSVFTRF